MPEQDCLIDRRPLLLPGGWGGLERKQALGQQHNGEGRVGATLFSLTEQQLEKLKKLAGIVAPLKESIISEEELRRFKSTK